MKRVLVLLAVSVACLAVAGTVSATDSNGTLRISWDGCDPQVLDKVFTTATTYRLVFSGDNFTAGPTQDDNVGYDFKVDIRPVGIGVLPDAWRFDDPGCQTGSQLALTSAAFSKACPVMKGTTPLPITSYGVDGANPAYAQMRLAIAYDTFSPSLGTAQRYTFWLVDFNHAFSVSGPTNPGVDCGNAATQLCIGPVSAILLSLRGDSAKLQLKGGDVPYVTWNTPGSCEGVPTVPATWGKVKSLYR